MDHNPLETRPETVALVALGPSHRDFIHARIGKKDSTHFDEIWIVNSGSEVFVGQKLWLMDDLRTMAERYPTWTERLKKTTLPIVTCHAYPEFPTSVEYPIKEVINDIGDDWFTNTVSYVIGYAIMTGVKNLYLFGADFMYPGNKVSEPGADCCSYLLGIGKMRGLNFRVPTSSTLLDSHLAVQQEDKSLRRPLYGYDYNPGECRRRVEAGTATDLEKLLALKAPHRTQELKYGPQSSSASVPQGQGRADGGRERKPLHPPVSAEPAGDHPAGRESLLGRRGDHIRAPLVGAGSAAALQPIPAGPHRVDGTGADLERVELTFVDRGCERSAAVEH